MDSEITPDVVEHYLSRTEDDFNFELRIHQICAQQNFECVHGGTYFDPITGKSRQFDIRAVSRGPFPITFAIECKNLQPTLPLIVRRLPRMRSESFHDVLRVVSGSLTNVRVDKWSYFAEDQPVGKSLVRMRKDAKNATAPDDVWEKYSQAIAHCTELVANALPSGARELQAFIPVLAVPDGSLWVMDYDSTGAPSSVPRQVPEATFYLGSSLVLPWGDATRRFSLTHLLLFTESGLRQRVVEISNHTGMSNQILPRWLYDPAASQFLR